MTETSFNQSVIDEFRANQGKVGGYFEGSELLLLTTTGARSGKPHTVPLGFVRHEGDLLIVGSNMGAPAHPAWYHNVLAHPMVQVEVGAEEYQAVAVPAEGARRDRLFAQVVAVEPGYGDYQRGTTRVLPVVVLERNDPAPGEGPAEVRTLADKILEVHVWLRGQLRHVAAETEAYFARRDASQAALPGLGLQIRQHCLAFCQALEFHHTGEDTHVFPGVEAYHPHLKDALDRLRAEHRSVARLQQSLAGLIADVGSADPEVFRTELARMSMELTAHLDHEEETLLPLLAEVPFPPGPPPAA
ncbi:nitroreductase/quinone reductase family protein [Streptomyces sp. NPDC048604]|uniref:nitroreductase/quinone reductase family protein n=1 Tax=Streptomyces sp. NPDC048604 TaxID=3365578 RepID=UPI003714820A